MSFLLFLFFPTNTNRDRDDKRNTKSALFNPSHTADWFNKKPRQFLKITGTYRHFICLEIMKLLLAIFLKILKKCLLLCICLQQIHFNKCDQDNKMIIKSALLAPFYTAQCHDTIHTIVCTPIVRTILTRNFLNHIIFIFSVMRRLKEKLFSETPKKHPYTWYTTKYNSETTRLDTPNFHLLKTIT